MCAQKHAIVCMVSCLHHASSKHPTQAWWDGAFNLAELSCWVLLTMLFFKSCFGKDSHVKKTRHHFLEKYYI